MFNIKESIASLDDVVQSISHLDEDERPVVSNMIIAQLRSSINEIKPLISSDLTENQLEDLKELVSKDEMTLVELKETMAAINNLDNLLRANGELSLVFIEMMEMSVNFIVHNKVHGNKESTVLEVREYLNTLKEENGK